ncbi:hypothetical protein BTVI_27374 [Pitangus sulphuratus]|nr:hypothetical protein BTVI_27374 [Pitangus sulphuratus]
MDSKSRNYRIIEYPELQGTHKDHLSPTPDPAQDPHEESHHMPQSIVQKLIELCQAWCYNHFPGEPVLVLNHPLDEESYPNIQPKPPLTVLGHSLTGELERDLTRACHDRTKGNGFKLREGLKEASGLRNQDILIDLGQTG